MYMKSVYIHLRQYKNDFLVTKGKYSPKSEQEDIACVRQTYQRKQKHVSELRWYNSDLG